MGYSFMTLEKIKSYGQMNAKWIHNYREKDVPNADKEKAHLNEELVSLNGKSYKEAFDERMKALGYGKNGKKIRSNAVYGFEVVQTFSREDLEHVDIKKWKENNVKWLKDTFNVNPEKYGDNVLSVMYHGDEVGNVHIHAFIVPIDGNGKLNARHFVQNRQKLIDMQDSYGKLMKDEHNLERGISGSSATHKDIKKFYAALNATLAKELPEPDKSDTILSYKQKVDKLYKDAVLKAMGLENKLKREINSRYQEIKNQVSKTTKELSEKYQQSKDKLDELEREFGDFNQVKEDLQTLKEIKEGINTELDEHKTNIQNLFEQLRLQGRKSLQKKKQQTKSDNGIR